MLAKTARSTPLSSEEIARVGLEIIDASGVQGLTMRGLGAELGCDPMAIYRHVADRDDLLSLVVVLVISEIELPAQDLDDRAWLLGFARNARQTFHRHPNAMILIGHSQLSATIGLEFIDQLAQRLHAPDHNLADRINAFLGAALGYVTLELSPPASRPRPVSLDAQEHPNLSTHSDELVGRTFGLRSGRLESVPLPGGFELLMTTLVEGLLMSAQRL